MPRQVSWQSVEIKPQPSEHGLGAEAAVAAEAPVGTMSAAHASTPRETPAATRITAAKMPSLAMRASLAQHARLWPGKVGRQDRIGTIFGDTRKFRSEWQPRHSHL